MVDFGIAAMLLENPTITSEIGTKEYLAPELIRGARTPSVHTDIYSLGILLYFMLKGVFPHNPDVDGFGMRRSNYFMPIDFSGIDSRIVNILEDCLERSFKNRPDSAEVFLNRLVEKFPDLQG